MWLSDNLVASDPMLMTQYKKNEILHFETAWMHLEGFMQSEMTQ